MYTSITNYRNTIMTLLSQVMPSQDEHGIEKTSSVTGDERKKRITMTSHQSNSIDINLNFSVYETTTMVSIERIRNRSVYFTVLVAFFFQGSRTSAFCPADLGLQHGYAVSSRQRLCDSNKMPFQRRSADWEDDWDPSYGTNDDNDDDASDDLVVLMQPKATTSHFFSQKSLSDSSFQTDPVFENLCSGIGISQPSKIQSLAWPVLLSGKHAIIAEQTGSGKVSSWSLQSSRL
jgi:hypothetical protein